MGVGVMIDSSGIVENVINLEAEDPLIDGVTCIYLDDRGAVDIGWVFTAPATFTPPID